MHNKLVPKYLHIVPDNKFISELIHDISSCDEIENHLFLAFNRYDPRSYKFSHLDESCIAYAPPGTSEFEARASNLAGYEKIFIHWFLPELEQFVASIPRGPTVYWCFWGEFDASFGILSKRLRYDRKSREFARIADSIWALNYSGERRLPWLSGTLRKWVGLLPRLGRHLKRIRAVSRIDVLLHWNEIDHELLRKICLHPRLGYEEFFYNVIDVGIPQSSDFVDLLWHEHGLEGKPVVMLGHSAFPSGNHLESLTLLAEQSEGLELTVIAIMSYGDPVYREVVIDKGRTLFGERFVAITEFLPVQHYYYLMSKVSAALLNHRFSEGAANIFRLVMDGKRVYLNPRSTIYQMLRNEGVAVFNIETELADICSGPLSEGDVFSNHQYITSRFSSTKARLNIERILRPVSGSKRIPGDRDEF